MFESLAGAEAAEVLAAVRPADLDDADLVELMRAWERLAAWAAAGQLAAVAELARRRPRDYVKGGPGRSDRGDPRVPAVSEFAVDEVAAGLRLTRLSAGVRVQLAVELAARLPGTAAALRDGRIDVPRAWVLADAVTPLEDGLAAAVEARVLPRAGALTTGQLRAAAARAVLAADPAAADRRHQRAVTDRAVTLRALPDGMAGLWALLPADAATAVYSRLDDLARRTPATDPRTMDARRADALITLTLDRTTTPTATGLGTAGALPATGCTAAVPTAAPADTSGVVRRTTAAGTTAGTPPVDTAGTADADVGAAMAGAGIAGLGAGAALAGTGPLPGGGVAGPVLAGAGVHITVAAATLLGVDDQPGQLAGHGPIPACMARRLAGPGNWRRLLTDPHTGTVIEVGRDRYTPAAALADLVRTRDRTCRFPGCRQPAHRCDLDHIIPWPAGPTTPQNLATLCRHHHRLKHQTGWKVHPGGQPGELTWTSPTGHRYTTTAADP